MDEQYRNEWFFQVYWLVANCCLVGFIEAIGPNLEPWTHAEAVQGKILWLNATLLSDQIGPLSYHIILTLVIVTTGLSSFIIFTCQRRPPKRLCSCLQEEQISEGGNPEQNHETREDVESNEIGENSTKGGLTQENRDSESLLDKILIQWNDVRKDLGHHICKAPTTHLQLCQGIWGLFSPLMEYVITLMIGWTLFSEVRAWAIVTMIIPFLPGIEWYSRDLKGQHRLLWFFFSLFFPLTVVGFRVKIL